MPCAKCRWRRLESIDGEGYGGGVESISTMNAVVSAVVENAAVMISMKRSRSACEVEEIELEVGVVGEVSISALCW